MNANIATLIRAWALKSEEATSNYLRYLKSCEELCKLSNELKDALGREINMPHIEIGGDFEIDG